MNQFASSSKFLVLTDNFNTKKKNTIILKWIYQIKLYDSINRAKTLTLLYQELCSCVHYWKDIETERG